VWTLQGPKPIEHVAVGEMVLAQHPDTGELAYRPVTQTTLGPPTQTIELSLPGETIVATLGHRFWVNGRGWEMAKSLGSPMQLHAMDAAVEVGSLKKGEKLECHNLVVDEFHTFFVGESRVLVHDKTCPRPTVSVTPGLRRSAENL
jgi:hypothetical protein